MCVWVLSSELLVSGEVCSKLKFAGIGEVMVCSEDSSHSSLPYSVWLRQHGLHEKHATPIPLGSSHKRNCHHYRCRHCRSGSCLSSEELRIPGSQVVCACVFVCDEEVWIALCGDVDNVAV